MTNDELIDELRRFAHAHDVQGDSEAAMRHEVAAQLIEQQAATLAKVREWTETPFRWDAYARRHITLDQASASACVSVRQILDELSGETS